MSLALEICKRHAAQVSPEQARELRDEGMQRAIEHAEADVPGWANLAYLFLCKYAKENRQFTSFDLRVAAREWGLVMPPTDKAFGSVFTKAAKNGVIRKAGYRAHPERHASPTVLWESQA